MKPAYYIFAAVGVALAATAAYISVSGMARVFAGSAVTVAVAMSVIEAGKLTTASLAYRMREIAPGALTAFLSIATVATMLITSAGIYGFLSAAYQDSASQLEQRDRRVASIDRRIDRFEQQVDRLDTRRQSIIDRQRQQEERVSSLSARYGERGWASDQEALNSAREQLASLEQALNTVSADIASSADSISALERRRINVQESSQDVDAKMSTVRFIAQNFGIPQDQAANVFILMIVFVFDPVAVCIVLAVNIASEHSGEGALFESTLTENDDDDDDDDNGDTGTPRSGHEVQPAETTQPAATQEQSDPDTPSPEAPESTPESTNTPGDDTGNADDYAEQERRSMRLSDSMTEDEITRVVQDALGDEQETRFRVHADGSVTRKHGNRGG